MASVATTRGLLGALQAHATQEQQHACDEAPPPREFVPGVTGLGAAHAPVPLEAAVAAARAAGFAVASPHAGAWDGRLHRGHLGPGSLSVRFALFTCGQAYFGIDGEDGEGGWAACDVESHGTWTWDGDAAVLSLAGLDGRFEIVRGGGDAEEVRVRGSPVSVRISAAALARDFATEAWGADAGGSEEDEA
jgi:hypothetical protein